MLPQHAQDVTTNFQVPPSARKIAAKTYNAWQVGCKTRSYARGLQKRDLMNVLLDLKNAVSDTTCVIVLIFSDLYVHI